MMVRRASVSDAPRLAEMAAKFVRTSSYSTVVTPNEQAMAVAFAAIIASDDGIAFVYETDGAVQGAIIGLIAPHLMTGGKVAVEVGWWVEPECRGGSGLKLLAAYEQAVSASGASLSVLTCPPDGGDRVGAIYDRAGYTKMETTYMRKMA